jgi:hypothetical protein
MDLQSASKLSGHRWQLARIGALLFFVIAGGLLVSSLLDQGRAGLAGGGGFGRATH